MIQALVLLRFDDEDTAAEAFVVAVFVGCMPDKIHIGQAEYIVEYARLVFPKDFNGGGFSRKTGE